MSLITLLRQEIERLARPGQAGTSVLAHRLLGGEGMGAGEAALLDRYDPQTQTGMRYAVYGRGRYGVGRYGARRRG